MNRNIHQPHVSETYKIMREELDAKKPPKSVCSNCAFYDEYGAVSGLCRRNAPGDYLPFPAGLHETGEVVYWEVGNQWPTVYPTDWCGEHSDLRGGVDR